MDDYDVYVEMNDIKPVLMGIDNGYSLFFQENVLSNKNVELMPIRLSYELADFSNEYIEKTKRLFIYYYDKNNSYHNELLKLKKHFKHYQRFPKIVFIPDGEEYQELRKLFVELKIKIINSEEELINYLDSKE